MLTIQQILKKTGLTLHNFQSWRRNDSCLLPRPVAVDKRVIYFDDSILARIKFIQARQAEGHTLAQIEELLRDELAQDSLNLPTREILEADSEAFMDETRAFLAKWQKPETCRADIIAALGLDPELSGPPTVFSVPRPARNREHCPLQIFTGVIFNGQVHFAELLADLYAEPKVIRRREISAAEFGMLLAVMGQAFAERKHILKNEMIPYLIFHGLDGTLASPAFWEEAVDVAQAMTPVFEGGRRFLAFLREQAEQSRRKQPQRSRRAPQHKT